MSVSEPPLDAVMEYSIRPDNRPTISWGKPVRPTLDLEVGGVDLFIACPAVVQRGSGSAI